MNVALLLRAAAVHRDLTVRGVTPVLLDSVPAGDGEVPAGTAPSSGRRGGGTRPPSAPSSLSFVGDVERAPSVCRLPAVLAD